VSAPDAQSKTPRFRILIVPSFAARELRKHHGGVRRHPWRARFRVPPVRGLGEDEAVARAADYRESLRFLQESEYRTDGTLMAGDDSCELSPEEEGLLKKHIDFYRDLETGRRQPTTQAQEHFVRVTRGLEAAETVHERAYAKHMRLRAQQRAAERSENPPDPADGPTPEWFSRDDWYRSRGRQRGDMRDE